LPSNTGEDTLGPISVTHKSEGLRGILDADTPFRIEFPLNMIHEHISEIVNGCSPLNDDIEDIHLLKNIFDLTLMKPIGIFNHKI
jgi:hypothetical protein